MDTFKTDNYLAENPGLSICDTTTSANGYPTELRKAIYGFNNLDEAKATAAALNGELCYIDKKDGWQVWHRKSAYIDKPFEMDAATLGYICSTDDLEEFESTAKDELLFAIQDQSKSLDELDDLMKDIIFLRDKVINLEEGEMLCYAKDGNFAANEVTKKETMSYYYDTKTTAIAVLL